MGSAERKEFVLGIDEGVGKEDSIYNQRFSSKEDQTRSAVWKILCSEFFNKYVLPTHTVVDLGAGDGHFVSNIKAAKKIAVDISPHVKELEKKGIDVVQSAATEFADKLEEPADVVFMSNFLEHLPNKRVLLDVLDECYQALKPGGRVIILQPNIRFVGVAYWDYIDHHIALTEKSLVEALEVAGFDVINLIPRFLPYTAKSNLGKAVGGGKNDWLMRLYLKLPFLWRLFGQQTLVVARRK